MTTTTEVNAINKTQMSVAEKEPVIIDFRNEMKMAFASLDHELNCQCASCECELILTAFREELLQPRCWCTAENSRHKRFYAVCIPFTPTEIKLLDTNNAEYIEDTYPTLASRIEKEIETGYLNDTLLEGRKRGMFCTAATRY
jgi:hypothetical protein